ncbi:MAG: hypothetical protein M3O67_05065 [Bacteroidota bacterium]|nr:hypothetical protein [Bacteroidota bacterium]
MENNPERKTVNDYPTDSDIARDLPQKREDARMEELKRKENRAEADLEDKEPAGDGGVEDFEGRNDDEPGKDDSRY